ncbi:sodium/hydrogen exchanger 7 isoform X2 [Arachis hypogaea]|uniref:sodium/hydrogen exchanger 7 isoform X2 n=1 Tax=Arachis hypogaea TaxID=3818 RepID=UPI003B21E145
MLWRMGLMALSIRAPMIAKMLQVLICTLSCLLLSKEFKICYLSCHWECSILHLQGQLLRVKVDKVYISFEEMVAYIANTSIFILSGVVIAEGVLGDDNVFHHDSLQILGSVEGTSWTYLLLLYVYVQVSRCIVVGALFPLLRYFGYGLDWKEASILIWSSGLQGAVALSLSLSVKRSSGQSLELTPKTGTLFVFFTGGIVFLTLIVNGSTTQFALHYLDMDKLIAEKKHILDFTKYEMLNKALEAFGELGDDEELREF